jgi:hypothetical protein
MTSWEEPPEAKARDWARQRRSDWCLWPRPAWQGLPASIDEFAETLADGGPAARNSWRTDRERVRRAADAYLRTVYQFQRYYGWSDPNEWGVGLDDEILDYEREIIVRFARLEFDPLLGMATVFRTPEGSHLPPDAVQRMVRWGVVGQFLAAMDEARPPRAASSSEEHPVYDQADHRIRMPDGTHIAVETSTGQRLIEVLIECKGEASHQTLCDLGSGIQKPGRDRKALLEKLPRLAPHLTLNDGIFRTTIRRA